jgi:hypothetical protein
VSNPAVEDIGSKSSRSARRPIIMSWRPATADWAIEETDNSLYADERNFYKVEKWSKDDQCIDCMLWAGANATRPRPKSLRSIGGTEIRWGR